MARPRFPLAGGVAVVTGAASGIGRATAQALARRGCALALVDRDAAGLAETARLTAGVRTTAYEMDVTDGAAVAALPDRVLADHGRVSVLVNNAGAALVGRFEETSMDEFRWLAEVNLFSVVGLTKAFLPLLQAQPAAHVVNVSSLFGLVAPAEQTAYVTTKFAVRGFSESLRHELEGTSVGVTVVHPGGVRTAISSSARLAAGADAAEAGRTNRAFERAFLKTPPEAVGEAIARAVERRQPRLLVASGARAAAAVQRLLPVSYWRVLRRDFERLKRP